MTSLEAYQLLLEKVNRNDTNSNIHIPRGKFVVLYNQQRLKWLQNKLVEYKDSQNLDYLDELLEDDTELDFIKIKHNSAIFKLPDDFFEFSSSFSLCTKGDCTGRVLTNWEIKSSDKRVILQDENHNPSFEYEETFVIPTSGNLSVYFSDFTVDRCFLTYYRTPGKIDIEGYIDINRNPSKNIDPDIPDDMVDQILDYCYMEIMRSNKDVEGFQLAKDKQK